MISIRSPIFSSTKAAVEFCIEIGLLNKEILCKYCGEKQRLYCDESCCQKYKYRCPNRHCRKTTHLLENNNINSPKIPLNDYLFVIFLWVEKNFSYNIIKNSNVSKSTVDRIKRIILKLIKKDNESDNKKIGTFMNAVQVDETIIIKGKLKICPSFQKDSLKNATWLVGAVEEDSYKIKLQIVPNRKKTTMEYFFVKNINEGVVVKTDGHKSYPHAVNKIKGVHIVVNHELGFKNSNGYTTNLIENVWSNLKSDIKMRKGIQKKTIPFYVEEFIWRMKNTREKSKESTENAFFVLLKLFFSSVSIND